MIPSAREEIGFPFNESYELRGGVTLIIPAVLTGRGLLGQVW
jgi:hypothetical protein